MSGRIKGVLVVAAAVAAHLWLQAGFMLKWAGYNTSYFRNYYAGDQLSYLAIVSDVAHGHSAVVEPYTLSGSIYYPRGYYILIGKIAGVTGLDPSTVWTAGGLAVQAALIAAIGVTSILLTRRWWAASFAFVPFVIGTGSWWVSSSWQTTLDSHAVLWGPFAVMYTLNGETIALSLGGIALLVLLLVGAGRVRGRAALVSTVAAFFVIGLLANIQTYAFLTSVYVVAFGVAAVFMVKVRSLVGALSTAVLVLVVALLGPVVAHGVSPLAALVFGLLPAVPGIVVAIRRVRWAAVWCMVAISLGASVQVVATVIGIINKDDFLMYRGASSTNLGVPWEHGVVAAAAVIPALLLIAALGLRSRNALWLAVPTGLVGTWAMLSTNDAWGANQEPYRLWLDVYVILAILVVPLFVWAVVGAFDGRVNTEVVPGAAAAAARRGADAAAAAISGSDTTDAAVVLDDPAPSTPLAEQVQPTPSNGESEREPRPLSRRGSVVLVAAVAVAVIVGAVWSVPDFRAFRRDVSHAGFLAISQPRNQAATALAKMTDGSVILTDACVDQLSFKPVWGGPVVYYGPGLAWPTPKDDFDNMLTTRSTPSAFSLESAKRANVGWIIADPTCTTDIRVIPGLTHVATKSYPAFELGTPAGSLELWKINF